MSLTCSTRKTADLYKFLGIIQPRIKPQTQFLLEYQQQLLGLISSSIIESDINTVIYEKGTLEEIRELISSLFVKEVQHLH